jgi:hypothetical protein
VIISDITSIISLFVLASGLEEWLDEPRFGIGSDMNSAAFILGPTQIRTRNPDRSQQTPIVLEFERERIDLICL